MKKLLIAISILAVFAAIFAQESEVTDTEKIDTSIQVITPENQHLVKDADGKAPVNGQVRIEYTQAYDEVRIFYTCMEISFERSDAMTTIADCLEDFQKSHNYFHYKYLQPDRVRYYTDARGVKMAEYVSYVKFTQ
jgi:hypothetical protein